MNNIIDRLKRVSHLISFERIVATLLVTAAVGITLAIGYRAYNESKLANAPVDVLKNWTLEVNRDKPYRPGDTISVQSTFTKLVAAKGESERSIQCVKTERIEEALTNYPNKFYNPPAELWGGRVNSNEGNGTKGKVTNGKTTIDVGIPFAVGQLPNVCRIAIVAVYNVNKYNTAFPETAYSNIFLIEPRPGIVTADSTTTYVYTDDSSPNDGQAYISLTPQNGESVIIYQNPSPSPSEETAPPTVQPQRGRIEQLTDPLVSGLDKTVDTLSGWIF